MFKMKVVDFIDINYCPLLGGKFGLIISVEVNLDLKTCSQKNHFLEKSKFYKQFLIF